jgi:hypothetical protein
MSYSIGPVRGATKALALAALAAAFDKTVLATQPDHAHDKEAHLASAERQLGLIGEPAENQDVSISMNGWLGWTGDGTTTPRTYTGAGYGCSVGYVVKEVQAPTAGDAGDPSAD